MGELIDDEILDTFAVVADRETIAAEVQGRFGGMVDRIQTGLEPGLSATAERRQGRLATQRSSAGQARAHSAVTIS